MYVWIYVWRVSGLNSGVSHRSNSSEHLASRPLYSIPTSQWLLEQLMYSNQGFAWRWASWLLLVRLRPDQTISLLLNQRQIVPEKMNWCLLCIFLTSFTWRKLSFYNLILNFFRLLQPVGSFTTTLRSDLLSLRISAARSGSESSYSNMLLAIRRLRIAIFLASPCFQLLAFKTVPQFVQAFLVWHSYKFLPYGGYNSSWISQLVSPLITFPSRVSQNSGNFESVISFQVVQTIPWQSVIILYSLIALSELPDCPCINKSLLLSYWPVGDNQYI